MFNLFTFLQIIIIIIHKLTLFGIRPPQSTLVKNRSTSIYKQYCAFNCPERHQGAIVYMLTGAALRWTFRELSGISME